MTVLCLSCGVCDRVFAMLSMTWMQVRENLVPCALESVVVSVRS